MREDKVKEIIEASATIQELFTIRQYTIHYKDVWNGTTRNGVIEQLPGNIAKREGIEPSLSICDEYHHATNNDMVSTMKGSMVASKHAALFIITTAGMKTDMPCYYYRQTAIARMRERKTNPRAFYYIFTIDNEDNWIDIQKWYKANPTLLAKVRKHTPHNSPILDAFNGVNKDDERDVRRFCALHLSQWSDAGTLAFISRENWRKLTMKFEENKKKKKGEKQKKMIEYIQEIRNDVVCTLGIDLSHVNDFTGLSILVRDKNNAMWLSTTFLITCGKKVENSELDPNEYPLRKHVQDGDLLVMGEELIDHAKIADFICNVLIKRLQITHQAYNV